MKSSFSGQRNNFHSLFNKAAFTLQLFLLGLYDVYFSLFFLLAAKEGCNLYQTPGRLARFVSGLLQKILVWHYHL
jgi:hypothetical protein